MKIIFFSLQKVGCDWMIDSDAILDKCGICKGDGTQCTLVDGVYTEKPHRGKLKIQSHLILSFINFKFILQIFFNLLHIYL